MSENRDVVLWQDPTRDPAIGLALGGGGARGLAHILMLEVLDELGVRPAKIAGTSIGAIFGALYAAGLSGRDIREHTLALLDSRTALFRRLVNRWPGAMTELWNPLTPSLFNPVTVLEIVLPEDIPKTFAELAIPFQAVTTDFYAQAENVIDEGPLLPAVAASAALPALMQPVVMDERVLIDGGFVNPVPFDHVQAGCDLTIAIDVNGKPRNGKGDIPNAMEVVLGSTQIILGAIMREKLKSRRPDILIRPDVGRFRVLDFFKIKEVFAAAEAARDQLKRELETKLSAAPQKRP